MNRFRTWGLAVLAVLLVAGVYYAFRQASRKRDEASRHNIAEGMKRQEEAESQRSPLPGDIILKDYAQPGTRPQDDLNALAHVFSNLTLLIKGDSPFRMGANEEFAAALRGKNQTKLRFMTDSHRAFNAQGQITDRWDTPLYFHAIAHDRIDMRSAGPDRQMWTADDLHRHYDGTFLKGDALNPASLFQQTAPSGRR